MNRLNVKNLDLKKLDLKKIARFQRVILVVAIVALLVVNGFLIKGYFGATTAKSMLEEGIEKSEVDIAWMEDLYNIAALKSELEAAERALAEDAPIPSKVTTIDVAKSVIDTAREAHITCFEFAPAYESTVTIGDNTYPVKNYSISISDPQSLKRLINFLRGLEELSYNTVMISDIDMTDSEAKGVWGLSFSMGIVTQ